ncbi:thioesterase family protein [Paenibacillus aurantius]|uniref:Thioesterase family protein n=1 Tax=Paenibacillus aurantius TaxID=2918900 RepID=A0AA96RDZ4_9BACL|nr:thioesterase family protein [Paenibacillus aurantius]WJH34732.1 acyl-CoA thioesterase [Paenibacillus sp. CC-CFT747]WNQ09941.1 thioesterase family protein [Paenibacillus aurantius]
MAAPWHKLELRVRYQETDQMGVVYHANYLNWFEIGRTEMIRALGMTYKDLEERGLLLPVLEAELKFRKPARYDDRITVYTRVTAHSPIRIQFDCEIRRIEEKEDRGARSLDEETVEPAGELLVEGNTKHVWLNRDWKPVRIDREVPGLYRLLQQRMLLEEE